MSTLVPGEATTSACFSNKAAFSPTDPEKNARLSDRDEPSFICTAALSPLPKVETGVGVEVDAVLETGLVLNVADLTWTPRLLQDGGRDLAFWAEDK